MNQQWHQLATGEFFRWFGLTEVGRSRQTGGGLIISCKPGGFQEAIDLTFEISANETVARAVLILNRAWMEDPRTAPFAADIAKSFLLTVTSAGSRAHLLAQQVEQLMIRSPGVISRAQAHEATDKGSDEAVRDALNALAGRRGRAELQDRDSVVLLENVSRDGQPRLHVICATLTPRPARWKRLLGAIKGDGL